MKVVFGTTHSWIWPFPKKGLSCLLFWLNLCSSEMYVSDYSSYFIVQVTSIFLPSAVYDTSIVISMKYLFTINISNDRQIITNILNYCVHRRYARISPSSSVFQILEAVMYRYFIHISFFLNRKSQRVLAAIWQTRCSTIASALSCFQKIMISVGHFSFHMWIAWTCDSG